MSLMRPDLGDARRVLREKFGFSEFLPGQGEALEAVLAGRDVLAVMPTGSGKSLLYQLPAMLRIGLVVVVSPLIALMRDQLRALEALGLPAAALHSGEDDFEIANAYEGVASGRVKLLYVAPEGLAREGTLGPPAQNARRLARRRRGPLHILLGSRFSSRIRPARRVGARALGARQYWP